MAGILTIVFEALGVVQPLTCSKRFEVLPRRCLQCLVHEALAARTFMPSIQTMLSASRENLEAQELQAILRYVCKVYVYKYKYICMSIVAMYAHLGPCKAHSFPYFRCISCMSETQRVPKTVRGAINATQAWFNM